MSTWEMVFRDGSVLARLLKQLIEQMNPWDPKARFLEENIPHHQCSIMDIEKARLASPIRREVLDATAEWAAMCLARWDYANEAGVVWEPYEQYEVNKFLLDLGVLGKSWRMATPIASLHMCVNPIGTLTCFNLGVLRSLLWDPNNYRINGSSDTLMEPATDM
ncbi:hypothetical protein M758_UG314400 [Ceratodon purpureus]|nr:hypothetical protein M758_UG314400 [Ceratodon purpureus]